MSRRLQQTKPYSPLGAEGAQAGRDRLLRGGSWNNNRNNARCAARNRNNPNNSNNNMGFRLVSHNSQSRRQCHGLACPPVQAQCVAEA